MAIQAGQLELNVMMPTMAYNVMQSATILANMLRQFNRSLRRRPSLSTKSVAISTRRARVPRYRAQPLYRYATAAEIVKESVATGESSSDRPR